MTDLVTVCVLAVGLLLDEQKVSLHRAEDFSDLTPPRVRVSVKYVPEIAIRRQAEELKQMKAFGLDGVALPITERKTEFYRCTFENNEIVELCPPEGCIFEDKRRTEEIRTLLSRNSTTE